MVGARGDEMTSKGKDKDLEEELERGEVPGDEIPGHLQEEEHSGVEAIFDMADYALTEEEKIALGIKRLDVTSPLDEAEKAEAEESSDGKS
jgi:hypothetical protein